MRILNLYACLGGNRLKWPDYICGCGFEFSFDLGKYGCPNCEGENEVELNEITAVELDPELARMYQERFPNDTVIVADAHQYLLDHYKEFDFIWSSPPCPTHSRARFWNSSNYDTTTEAIYPDMKLYQEILFLEHYFKGKYVVENVIPYYEPLIPAQKRGRHLYWSNFIITQNLNIRKYRVSGNKSNPLNNELEKLSIFHQINLEGYNGNQSKIKIARNLVDYKVGEHIFNLARGIHEANNSEQTNLFE